MTGKTITYTVPDLITLPMNDIDAARVFKPELTCFDQGQGKDPRYLYPYRLCYLDRRSLDPTISSFKKRKEVNLSSLCVKRVALLQPIIKGILEGRSNISTFRRIESVLDWIDREERSEELNSTEDVRLLYRDYTDHLRHRLRLSNVGDTTHSIAHSTAYQQQSAFTHLCIQVCGHDPKVVKSWAIQIPQRGARLNELPAPNTTTDEHALACALHQRFFDAFSQTVLHNIAPPVVVKLADLGFEDLIYYSRNANNANGWSVKTKGERTDWQPFFYRRDGVFEGKPKVFNALLAEHSIAPINTKAFNRLQDNNRHFSQSALRELANYATRHFG